MSDAKYTSRSRNVSENIKTSANTLAFIFQNTDSRLGGYPATFKKPCTLFLKYQKNKMQTSSTSQALIYVLNIFQLNVD